MNISLWRTNLKTWLSTYVLIDSWELRNPVVYNTTNGFIPPLSAITFDDGSTEIASAVSDFYLTTRYPSSLKYDQLPLATLEQLYTSIVLRLNAEYSGIAPLMEFSMSPINECIQVQEYGDDVADWLITMVFSCKLFWTPDITALPGGNPTPISLVSITSGLFTEQLSSTDHRNPLTRDKVGNIVVTK
jgi:hypothetical protein